MLPFLIMAAGVWWVYRDAAKTKSHEDKEVDTKTGTKITSGYDPYKDVYWTLEQKWRYKED